MPLNVKDFGARGDGGTDDTAAIQLAFDALMAIPRGGTLYFPAGIYIVKYTLQLVGNPGHNYTIIGDGGGLTSITTLKWAGPAKCTMLDCWGLNWTQFKGLIFDGGGTNLSIAGPSDPPVGTLGAGCATWFHTNQFNTVSHPGIGRGGPTFNVFFDDCSWQSVIGGNYAACAIGDGSLSPGNVTVDKNGAITLYEVETLTPPRDGPNAVDTLVTTTLASDAPIGIQIFPLTDATGFIVNRAIYVSRAGSIPWRGRITDIDIAHNIVTASDGGGLPFTALAGSRVYDVKTITPPTVGENAVDTVVTTTLASGAAMGAKTFTLKDVTGFKKLNKAIFVSRAGFNPWCGRITDITGNVVTASDLVGGGLTFTAPAGASVYNVFPNAVAESRPSGSVVTIPFQVQNSECDGFYFNRCNFVGGGWDTTVANQYNYAGLAIYSGANTEQFGFRDTQFFTQAGVFGIYSPYQPNNEWFLENVQFGPFSAAALFSSLEKATMPK